MANLLDSVRHYLSADLIHQAAALWGENENGISKAAGSLAPTLLTGILHKIGDQGTLHTVFQAIRGFDPGVLDQLPGLLGSGNLAHHDPKDDAGHLLGTLFGDKVPALTNAVAAFSGTKASTVSSLWGLVGPLVMGLLSKRIGDEQLSVSGFANLFNSEKSSLLAALPAGVAALINPTDAQQGPLSESAPAEGGVKWLWPLLLLLGLGGGIMYYLKNCRQAEVVEMPAPGAPVVAAPDSVPPPPAAFEKTLSNGFALKGNPDGIEQSLIAFIEGNNPVDKTTWFNFDRLTFRTGSAEIDMDKSRDQLTNIYQIMQAFPKLKLKVGGYTDNIGKEADNMKLSQARAEATVKALETMGVAKGRLAPEGYGSQHPVAPNDTEEGRAQNRRIAVRVMEK